MTSLGLGIGLDIGARVPVKDQAHPRACWDRVLVEALDVDGDDVFVTVLQSYVCPEYGWHEWINPYNGETSKLRVLSWRVIYTKIEED